MIKRRDFLSTCAAGSVALATPISLAGTHNLINSVTRGQSSLLKETCQSLLQDYFRCFSESESQSSVLKLVEIRKGPEVAGLEQFALVFEAHGGKALKLSDGLHTLVHPKTGWSLLHLTTSDSEKNRYISYLGLFS